MATIQLPTDFREFLRLLNIHEIAYLLIGGYAVGYHGFPRSTGDMDIWIASTPENARKIVRALDEFGFSEAGATESLFQQPHKIIRMGNPPLRIEMLTTISGVEFASCYAARVEAEIDGLMVKIINLNDLRTNKLASGRLKDLNDLENIPE